MAHAKDVTMPKMWGRGRRRVSEEAAATVADDVWSMVNLAAVYFDCCASGARITM